MDRARQYRERAAHARRLAEKTHDLTAQEQLETVATDYDRTADEIERRLSVRPEQRRPD